MTERYYGLLAEYARAERLVAATRAARAAGYTRLEAYSPFPLDELEEPLGLHSAAVYAFGVAGAVFGALAGYGLQVYATLGYPLEIGGRPLLSLTAFSVVAFLLMVGFAVLFTVVGLLWRCRLPLLHHPLFEAQVFARASDDRFLLCIRADDPLFERSDTALWLAEGALSVTEVPA